MKSKILLIVGAMLGIGLLISTAWIGVSYAADVRTGESPTVRADEVIDSTLYIAGDTLDIKGIIKGDLFCAGNDIDITATVEGDVICAGQNVRVNGNVLGDVRAAGMNVDVNAVVQGGLTAAGQALTLGSDAKVERDVTLAGSSARLRGDIGRDVLGSATNIIVTGHIGRNLSAEVASLRLESGASIHGNLDYRAPAQAFIARDATVQGQTYYTEQGQKSDVDHVAITLWTSLYWFVALLLIGLVALLAAPRVLDGASATLRTRKIISFAAGAATLLAVPIFAITLFVSLLGIPLAILLMSAWLMGLISSLVIAAYAIGWTITEKFLNWPPRGRRLANLIIGLLVTILIGLLPVIGPIIIFLLILSGLGAIVMTIASRLSPPKATKGSKK